MRTLNRNKQTIYYALYQEGTFDVDEYGDLTGEELSSYSDPVKLRCNISAPSGTDTSEMFGIHTDYTRVLCIEGTNCPIKEDSIVWYGKTPDDGQYNYIVKAVVKSLNSTLIAVKEMKVS